MTPEEIDRAAQAIIDVIDAAAKIWPQLRLARPLIVAFIRYEAYKLKRGIEDGTVVPDGAGGWVPASNSRYNPRTGRFID